MSLEATRAAWELQCRSAATKVVLLCLADYANAEGVAWPSLATIGVRCHMTAKQAASHVKALVAVGHITILSEAGAHRSRRYLVRVFDPIDGGKNSSPQKRPTSPPSMSIFPPIDGYRSGRTVRDGSTRRSDGGAGAPPERRAEPKSARGQGGRAGGGGRGGGGGRLHLPPPDYTEAL